MRALAIALLLTACGTVEPIDGQPYPHEPAYFERNPLTAYLVELGLPIREPDCPPGGPRYVLAGAGRFDPVGDVAYGTGHAWMWRHEYLHRCGYRHPGDVRR